MHTYEAFVNLCNDQSEDLRNMLETVAEALGQLRFLDDSLHHVAVAAFVHPARGLSFCTIVVL